MEDSQKNDIDEMLADMIPSAEPPKEEPPAEEPPKEEPPKEEPPKEEPPAEEPPKEEPPKEEPPKEEPPKEEPPKEEPPKEPPAEEELEQERAQTKLLLERIETLSDPTRLAEIVRGREPVAEPTAEPTKPSEPTPTPAPTPAPTPTPEPPKPVDFVGSRELADIVDKTEGLNEVLNKVMNEAAGRNVDVVVEKILTAIPQLVAGQIVQQNTINKMVGEFYDANKDLASAKRTVGIFVNEVHSEHSDWKTEDVFKEAGTRTRKALGLREQASPTPTKSPAFARQRGSHKRGGDNEPQLEGLAKEIDELIQD